MGTMLRRWYHLYEDDVDDYDYEDDDDDEEDYGRKIESMKGLEEYWWS